ncbi:TadE/TadG family type IV pilus assembly protein [Ensifer soli]|uniref:TadE/TadG family type IV pilus assembly protein n=1 Tax=Ciceribacter sp. sgz301302 TaxID=3342379 RepID=UPI0035B84C59
MGAVEFAIIAPILIVTYMGAFEISLGFTVARKVARASGTVADLVAQESTITATYLDGMQNVATSIMAPYPMTGYTLKITGIRVTGTGTGTVAWSRDQAGGRPYATGSTESIPSDISTVGSFVVRSELVVPHDLMLFAANMSGSALQTIDLSRTYYYRQRIGEVISCATC